MGAGRPARDCDFEARRAIAAGIPPGKVQLTAQVLGQGFDELAREHGKEVATHLFGQEINAETYAICKADLLLKGEGEAAAHAVADDADLVVSVERCGIGDR